MGLAVTVNPIFSFSFLKTLQSNKEKDPIGTKEYL